MSDHLNEKNIGEHICPYPNSESKSRITQEGVVRIIKIIITTVLIYCGLYSMMMGAIYVYSLYPNAADRMDFHAGGVAMVQVVAPVMLCIFYFTEIRPSMQGD